MKLAQQKNLKFRYEKFKLFLDYSYMKRILHNCITLEQVQNVYNWGIEILHNEKRPFIYVSLFNIFYGKALLEVINEYINNFTSDYFNLICLTSNITHYESRIL